MSIYQGTLFGQGELFADGAPGSSPAAPPACRTCGFTDCPNAGRGGECPRWASPAEVPGSVCIAGSCLEHRRGTYWNIQDAAWVHTDGYPCDSLRSLPDPGCLLVKCCGAYVAVGHIPARCPSCGRVMIADADGQVLSLPGPAPVKPAAPAPPTPPKWTQRIITCALCGYSTDKPHLMRAYAGSKTAKCCDNDGACKQRQEQPEAFRHARRLPGGPR